MRKLALIVALLLAAALAGAQGVTTIPPGSSGGATFTGGTITTPILGVPGDCVTVPYSFAGFTTTGFGHTTIVDAAVVCVGGVELFRFNALGAISQLTLQVPPGTAAAPGLVFSGGTTTGLYHLSPGIGFAVAGAQVGSWTATALTSIPAILGPGFQTASTGYFNFSSGAVGAASDTGLARSAAGVVKVTDGGAGNGSVRVADGSAAAPSYSFSAASTNGFYYAGSSFIGHSAGGLAQVLFGTTEIRNRSTNQYAWSSGDPSAAASDTGLARSSAAVARATNGSTGLGYMLAGVSVEANTGTKAPTVIESGRLYTNTGDTDGSTINLPNDPTIGTTYTVTAVAAQDITLAPATGETIMFGNTVCGTSFVIGGAATGIGDSVTVVAATGGSGAVWITTAFAGTPVCTP